MTPVPSDSPLMKVDMQETPPERVVIFNVFGHLNRGDAVLLETLVDLIKLYRPNRLVSGIAFDTRAQNRWMPEIAWAERIGKAEGRGVFARLGQVPVLMAAILISFHRAFRHIGRVLPARQRLALQSLCDAELAISCPGGYLEDSNFAYLVNCISILVASRLAKSVVLAPQSIGPIGSRIGRFMIRRVIDRVDIVFLRERESLTCLTEILGSNAGDLIRDKVRVVGDVAFWFTRKPTDRSGEGQALLSLAEGKKILGLTVVDWSFPQVRNSSKAREQYLRSLSELIEHVHASGSHKIVIFNQVESDLSLAYYLRQLHPEIIVDISERECATYSGLIGMCDLFVGTRFHSCIFALLNAVPTTAIAYLPKTMGMMRDLGLQEHVIDITEVTGPGLIASFENMRKNRHRLSQIINERLDAYRAEQDGFVRYLAGGDHPLGSFQIPAGGYAF